VHQVRLWARARGAEETDAQRLQTLSGAEPGLVGYWRLDDGRRDLAVNGARGGGGGGAGGGSLDGRFVGGAAAGWEDPTVLGITPLR
jgi:hypothetical protein